MLTDVREPNLFVIRKQNRDGPEKVTPQLTYYILDGCIYQAPQLCNVFYSRIVSIVYIQLMQNTFIVVSLHDRLQISNAAGEGSP